MSSKMAIGESNQYGSTGLANPGKMRKIKAQITHHADDTTPKTAIPFGIYLDLSHNQAQTVAANPKNGRPT